MGEALPALLTIEEAGAVLRVGRTKAYAMAKEWRATGGRVGLPVVDFGNVLRVPRKALEALVGSELTDALHVVKTTEPHEPVDIEPVPIAASRPRRPRRQASDQPGLFDLPPAS